MRPVEWGLWLLSLALVMRLTLLSRRRPLEEFESIDRFALVQIAIVFACLIVVLFSGRFASVWRRIEHRASGLLVIFYLFGAVSCMWSPRPAFSLYRAIEAVSQVAIIHLALSHAWDFAAAERRALLAVLASMLLGLLSVITTLGLELRFDFWHTNQYSVPAMIAFTYAVGELFSGRRADRGFLVFVGVAGLTGMAIGTSSASTISALCGIAVAVMLSRDRRRKLFLLGLLAAGIMLYGGVALVKELVFYGKSEVNIEQLSGRAYFWQGYLRQFAEHPILGQGFAVSARISTYWRSTNTHNAILSVLLGTGIVGMAIASRAVGRWFFDSLRAARQRRRGSVGCAAAISAGLVNSMSVAYLGETWMMSSFAFVCILALSSMFVVGRRT